MRFTRMGRRALFLALLVLLLVTARVSADTTDDDNAPTTAADKVTDAKPTEATAGPTTANDATATSAGTTDPPSTTIDSTTDSDSTTTTTTTTSTQSTQSTDSESSTTSTMETTTTDTISTTTSSTSSSTTDSTTSTTSSSTSASDSLIPIVTVPPTADAPYMQKSSTPEGTLFIAVGAALGVIGLSVLAWRVLVAWSVNRSVKRAAAIHSSETKGLLRTRKKKKRRSVYSRGGHTSNMSLDRLGKSTRHSHRPSKTPSSNSGLFFSPTAGAGMRGSGNRGSNYLPAGYYAAGNVVAGGGQNTTYIPPSLSVSGPQAQGYTRTKSGPSPPSTPILPSSSVHDTSYNSRQSFANPSTSSLNLASPSQPRAPSAYLEDLFESHAPPSDLSHR